MAAAWSRPEDDVEILGQLLPEEAGALVDRLGRDGYRVACERYDEGDFGNLALVLAHDETFVRVVRDRGQWFVEVADASGQNWFSPTVWRAFLESTEAPLDLVPLGSEKSSGYLRTSISSRL